MKTDMPLSAINDLIIRKNPLEDTLETIVEQLFEREAIALVRIWLIDKGDICATCHMRQECPNQELCLHLTASEGADTKNQIRWNKTDGKFQRFPIGIRKIGFVAEKGESVLIDELQIKTSHWIADPDWIEAEKIVGFAAHPLKFQTDILGVLGVFSRKSISEETFEWLRAYADQASVAIANARAFEELEKLRQNLEYENDYLREEVSTYSRHKFLIGASPVWQKILGQIEMVGATDTSVLITGESGTGKELVARAIHESSPRKNKRMVKVNCAAITSELFESEFFGHTKGAFTGAINERLGRFQVADGGTIFLDEIGEVPLELQGKLLRVLQEKQFERVGEDNTRTVDVRIVAATNRDLLVEVKKGNFREDLFYRLSVFPIHIPPLRERIEDIEPLSKHFVQQYSEDNRSGKLPITNRDIEILKSYSYPGNVRELENIIERAVILAQGSFLKFSASELLNRALVSENDESGNEKLLDPKIRNYDELKELERENLINALQKTNYKIYGTDGAAELLKTKPTTLISRIKKMGIPMRPSR